jgi:hypothetical protein
MVRARRVKKERTTVAWVLLDKPRPALPVEITLVRRAPSNGLDPDDNLPMSLKAVKDQVAVWLGVDDRDPRVQWKYDQLRDKLWSVTIEVQAMAAVPA